MSEKKVSNHKMRPYTIILLSAIVSLFTGLAGGWFAVTHLQPNSITVYQSNDNSNTSTVVTSNSNDSQMTITSAAAKASPSVVEINTESEKTSYGFFGGSYIAQGAGSGVILSEDGYIITNHHVVSDSTSITVTTYDGKTYPATLIGSDKMSDIAIIKVEASDLTAVTLGDSAKIQPGDTAI
ncbi:MAG: trypsin-like peptidase domain-containing protein, partial [Solobacterium sp.]|nr:trypsin-like peptidase domain-containing protein [Solobacterium sp.]